MDIEKARFNMIEQQIRPWEVLDLGVLALLNVMKREDFVPEEHRALAFVDMEVPLPGGQCMLWPKVEARLLQELEVKRDESVLEIGAGSGYMAALLAHRARQVVSLEIDPTLVKLATDNLRRADVGNAQVMQADASKSLPVKGPFDVILLSGSVYQVPAAILSLLKVGGRLAAIVGIEPVMTAQLITRTSESDYQTVILFDTVAQRLSGFGEPSRFKF